MSQTLNYVLAFDGTKYGYWKARIRFFFFKSIDVWKIVESGWIKPKETTDELIVAQTSVRLSNNKALRACPWIQQEFERLTSMSSAFTF
jgi:hypothetical protein